MGIKKKVNSEQEVELNEGQMAFGDYISEKIRDDPVFQDKISEIVKNKITAELKDVIEVAQNTKKSPSYKDMLEDVKVEEELLQEGKESE